MAEKKERRMPKYPPKPEKGGRPILLTKEVQDKICNSIVLGNYFETACAAAGIHKTTGYDWLRRGNNEPDSIFEAFSHAVEKAEGDCESRDVMALDMMGHGAPAQYMKDEKGNLKLDGNGNPVVLREEVKRNHQVLTWRLERKYPKRWGRLDRHEHSGKDGGPITFSSLMKKIEEGNKDEDESE